MAGATLRDLAMQYYEMGLNVFPLSPKVKVPMKGFELIKVFEKMVEKEQVERWWKDTPEANIGIATGKISNLFVVDLDKYKEGYSDELALNMFPDSLITPSSSTPNGGTHLYFRYPEDEQLTIKTDSKIAIDYRGIGGYIVAPPSYYDAIKAHKPNDKSGPYSWMPSLSIFDSALGAVPAPYIEYIKKYTLYGNVTALRDKGVTGVTDRDIWADGSKDESLFHVAWCMTQTKNDDEYIRQTLRMIALGWGETNESWINAKIKSAMDREDRKERNLSELLDDWLRDTDRDWNVNMCDKELQIVTQRDMATRRKWISRRKDVTLEKAGSKAGWWRRIDTDITFMDFDEPDEIESPIILPLELHNLVKICQGNIILASGEFNAGKTTFAMNVLVSNKNRVPIRYMSSEAKVGEIKSRFKMFGLQKEQWWPDENCQYVELRNNLTALLLPDGLNIIDYLEFPDGDYTKGAEYMRQIHDKLKTGVAIVCNQQKEGVRLPRSGDMILEKPRLAVTFRKLQCDSDDVIGIAEIIKAKNVTIGKMDNKRLKYQITGNGSTFKTLINWGWWK